MNIVVKAACCLVILLLVAGTARGQVDEGSAKHIPWSGYWFPMAKGEILEPLRKYDALTGRNAFAWEYQRNPPGQNVPEWHGYCHAWAAAAVLEKEPSQVRAAHYGNGSIPLRISDQKAWLTACHSADAANSYGDRYGDGQGMEDPGDLTPDALWQLLRMFLRDQRVALIMDLDPGPEVWNYPVYAYRIEYGPHPAAQGWFHAQLGLWAADDAVPPDFVGLVPHYQTYTFQFQMRGRSIVAGSARWTGQSVQDHPDFAWYPYVVMAENPELHYPNVKKLLQSSTPVGAPASEGNGATGVQPHIPGFSPVDSSGQSDASNQPVPVSPMQLVSAVANRTSKFGFDLRSAEFGKVQYAIGEGLQLVGTSSQDGYLYLLHIDPLGELTLLYPSPGDDNRVAASVEFRFPRQKVGEVRGPLGNHCVKAIITQQPLILTGFSHMPRRDATAEAWQPRTLLLCPTQTKLVKSLLGEYVQGKSLDDRQLPGDIASRLPGFAQDEFTSYVGPAR
ncbi:MAG TPA: DUF4384 domain-containing protein [Pirellulaceae bacterium]|nr:DUF4384 domain-containing protein [Pirellulaceae bacterium]